MRLIITTDSAVTHVSGRNALTAFLEAKGWAVWHWFQDLWLIDGVPEQIDVVALREEIRAAIPGGLPHFLILSAEGLIIYSGMVPTTSLQWLTEHWNRRH
jgi:hypothetical protein